MHRLFVRGSSSALLLMAFCGAAVAQSAAPQSSGSAAQLPRITQDVFVTATVSEVDGPPPRTTAVLTRDDLERLGATSIIDALRLIPGIDPRARGPREVQTDFSIRGSTFGQNLVLIDGFRLNNSQSGHHNGEIPVPLSAVERVEVVYGAGSAIHGADALGGTINVITRRGSFVTAEAVGGQHGYSAAQASISGRGLPDGWTIAGWGSRSSGFMFDRDHALGGALLRADVTRELTIDVRHQRRAFGANGFYGPSPSKEWTDGTLAGATWRRAGSAWIGTVKGAVRVHHDHFLWDINRPGFAENRHRTNAVDLSATIARDWSGGRRTTFGVTGGGDRVESSNLGNHTYSRAGLFGELLLPAGNRTVSQLGIRLDEYSTFGTSVSPSIGSSVQVSPSVRLHASVSHAFRVPTFTELYYSDPANVGNPDLHAESGWSFDVGAEWARDNWTASFTPFWRQDEDVIDWTREQPSDRWRSTNIRDVTTRGFEAAVARRWRDRLVRVYYSLLDVDAPALAVMSKYVLEYARHQSGGTISTPIGAGVRVTLNVDHRHRIDGQSYQLVSARVSRPLALLDVFVDGTNLLNEDYQEITGVAMPGRWITAGIAIR